MSMKSTVVTTGDAKRERITAAVPAAHHQNINAIRQYLGSVANVAAFAAQAEDPNEVRAGLRLIAREVPRTSERLGVML